MGRNAPIETWSWWAPFVSTVVCLGLGVFAHRCFFPRVERTLWHVSQRLTQFPCLMLVVKESVKRALFPAVGRCVLASSFYGRVRCGDGGVAVRAILTLRLYRPRTFTTGSHVRLGACGAACTENEHSLLT
jgi:hypothetical protein